MVYSTPRKAQRARNNRQPADRASLETGMRGKRRRWAVIRMPPFMLPPGKGINEPSPKNGARASRLTHQALQSVFDQVPTAEAAAPFCGDAPFAPEGTGQLA